ncbi:MAG: tRNA pseudouridine(38-40) synthase TruA [Candidatus Omnitrophota bacterium]
MLRTIKLTIEYDGTDFSGWQIQKNSRTVQDEIEKASKHIFKQPIRLVGSGRTDSGVHASGQVAHFQTDTKLTNQKICLALNSRLPCDVVILTAADVSEKFHAQYNVKSKVYRYLILNRKIPCALKRNFCAFYPYPLNVNKMRQEAKCLIGTKDFKSFQAADPSAQYRQKNTVRQVKRINIRKNEDFVSIEIESNGFLYKMVRNIVGALLAIGSGQLPEGSIVRILKQKDRRCAPKTAPAKGLCLLEVKY